MYTMQSEELDHEYSLPNEDCILSPNSATSEVWWLFDLALSIKVHSQSADVSTPMVLSTTESVQ